MIHDLNISLEDLHLFYHVVHKGGFLKAAQAINICQGKASRRVAHLERVLGVILLHRNMRDIALTEPGEKLYAMAQKVLETAHQTFTDIKAAQKDIAGDITLAVTSGFGSFWLMPKLAAFLEEHTNITLRIKSNDRDDADLMLGQVDIAISSVRPDQREALVCEVLCEYPFHLYASAQYLKKHGMPKSIIDLDQHRTIIWEGAMAPLSSHDLFNAPLFWGRNSDNPRKPCMHVENDFNTVGAVLGSVGLKYMPQFLGDALPGVKRISLKDMPQKNKKILYKKYISYPKFLDHSDRYMTLINFIKDEAAKSFLK